ncbi:hypothetical protein [Nocardioides sp. URHA0020]|uniref:hypothetical protein n=1 Tax=Nocardioides sp. URHA0020 TaxID=1380392 RepID=UPI00048A5479|nr:hypothetical protein [Nocardioides sp. URHA0020]
MTHAATLQRESVRPVEPAEDAAAVAESRALDHVRALNDLFGRRPDLAGVYSPADLATEAVLWCV